MIRAIFITLLRGYQIIISPWLGNRCRFYPSCSEYMIEAVRRFGVFRGVQLGLKRLAKCQPLCEGGVDPVPEMDAVTKRPILAKHKHENKPNNVEQNQSNKDNQ